MRARRREYEDRIQLRGRAKGGAHLTLVESVRQHPSRRMTTFEQRYLVRRGSDVREHRFELTFRTVSVPAMRRLLERAGFRVIRGSGTQSPLKVKAKRAVPAFFEMREALRHGTSLLLTADVPKVARVAGKGAVQLARATGRPIYLFAAVTSARVDLDNWDKASIALPFGRGCVLWSEPLYVRRAADEREMGLNALEIANGLDELHATAHRLLGQRR